MEQAGPGVIRSGRGRGEAIDRFPVEVVGLIRAGQQRPGSGEQAEGVLGAAGLGPARHRLERQSGCLVIVRAHRRLDEIGEHAGVDPEESPATRA